MKILAERPPLYDMIAARFPGADKAIFSWGDRIYNLSGKDLPNSLLAHEMIHMAQQGGFKQGVEAWWEYYVYNDRFRLDMEIPAHAAEYRILCMGANRHFRRAALMRVATRLSGPLYGRLVSLAEAKRLIIEAAEPSETYAQAIQSKKEATGDAE